jgi:hypothetical protein
MITDKISTNISVEDLRNELSNTYDNVKPKGRKSLTLNYNGTKIIISKQKKGFDVSPNIPGYVFWIFFLLVVILYFLFSNINRDAINEDNWPSLVIDPAVRGFVFGGILYWIFAEVYIMTKKKIIKDFCDSLQQL